MRGMDGTLTRLNKQRIGKLPVRPQVSKGSLPPVAAARVARRGERGSGRPADISRAVAGGRIFGDGQ